VSSVLRLATLIVVALMLGPASNGSSTRLLGQISPGPLARAHGDLEGTLKCTKCHAGRKDAMSANCQGCHRDVEWLVRQNRGYHAGREVRGATCASCHPDHAGQDFRLIKWPDGSRERFDHRRAGWPLAQRHGELDCADCHTTKFQLSPAAKLAAKTPGVLTGLETACASCHEDVHRGGLSNECSKCHDAGKWNITPGFDHDTTAYPLTNKHAVVNCDKCHLTAALATRRDAGGHLIPVYRPVPHAACTACHEDVHKGQFGANCTTCHTTGGWKQIDRNRFDHAKTRYPLRGKHASVTCADCHQNFSTPALKKPVFQTCGACHQDPHNGTATLASRVVDCEKCHGLLGFAQSTFTAEQHRNTRYALEGKHLTVKCGACHRKETNVLAATKWGSAKVVIRPAFMNCLDCHTDDHGGQLLAQKTKGACENCHRVVGWRPSTFDLAAHAKLRLPLEERHGEIQCRDCHAADRKGLPPLPKTVTVGKAGFLFKVVETDCSACHVDPHRGRFTASGPRAKPAGCAACHNSRTFRPSATDVATHKSFNFPLEGAHRATPCMACHPEMKTAPPKRSSLVGGGAVFAELRYSAKTLCADCHETPHGNQFAARKDAGKCDACHGTDGFAPAARFDHNRDASFSLKGAHEGVPCHDCHPSDTKSRDPRRLLFRPVSGKCESCHAEKENR
jgi:hypothetical protein